MKNIVLFASGSGTNVENLLLYFNQNPIAKVVSVFCNNQNAKVIDRALKFQIPVIIFSKDDFKNNIVLDKLTEYKPDLIVLAGFLLQFPQSIIEKFPNHIINIHPALLPKYGGKGMYGSYVHQSVFDNNEIETGITIHYVNENYDEGAILFQESISIEECKSPEEIASKVHQLEHQNYPVIIEQILMQ
jgi:phosphoribosylglycinamide formyltransferase-1